MKSVNRDYEQQQTVKCVNRVDLDLNLQNNFNVINADFKYLNKTFSSLNNCFIGQNRLHKYLANTII